MYKIHRSSILIYILSFLTFTMLFISQNENVGGWRGKVVQKAKGWKLKTMISFWLIFYLLTNALYPQFSLTFVMLFFCFTMEARMLTRESGEERKRVNIEKQNQIMVDLLSVNQHSTFFLKDPATILITWLYMLEYGAR